MSQAKYLTLIITFYYGYKRYMVFRLIGNFFFFKKFPIKRKSKN